jgi:sortase (surface protein transpeptidase)
VRRLARQSNAPLRHGLHVTRHRRPSDPPSLHRVALWLLLLVAAVVVVLVAVAFVNDREHRVEGLNSAAVTAPHAGAAAGLQDPAERTAAPTRAGVVATRLEIPEIGVSTDLESLALDSAGELMPPVDYEEAGWYTGGVVPGDVGPAIIAGHVDSAVGPAVFERLAELSDGALVMLTLSNGETLTFEAHEHVQSAKATFPTSDVYGAVPTPQVRLITCGGDFDRASGHYTDNLIVFATLVAP